MNGLTTTGLTKSYGTTQALDGIDLVVPAGSTYGLVGPNGSGTTTTLELLAGLRHPTSGTIRFDVSDGRVAYCPDAAEFEPWLTAVETLDVSARITGVTPTLPDLRALLDRVGLADAADRRVGGFSRGMTSRLNLAAGLVTDPTLLVADEPAAALDPAGRWEIIELLADLAGELTVIVSSHDLAEVERICDTIGVLTGGQLAYQGSLAELLDRAAPALRLVVRPPASTLLAALSGASWVRAVSEGAPGDLRIDLADDAAAEIELPRLLADSGARLVALERAGVGLQDIFFELTGTGPRRPEPHSVR